MKHERNMTAECGDGVQGGAGALRLGDSLRGAELVEWSPRRNGAFCGRLELGHDVEGEAERNLGRQMVRNEPPGT